MRLIQPQTALVEVVKHSGYTDSGILIFDHDEAKDVTGRPIALLHRVLETHPSCKYVKPGMVVGLCNPYAVSTIKADGLDYLVVHEDNVEYEVEGYDEKAEALAQVVGL